MKNTITLKTTTDLRSKKNRKLISKLLKQGWSLRLDRIAEASRFDRR